MADMKTKTGTTVIKNTEIADGVFDMTLRYPEGKAPSEVKPGQFVGVFMNDASKLLPRPISICGWDPEKRDLRLVYRVAGKGTKELSEASSGDAFEVLGILGNGYDIRVLAGKRVLLAGGGIGAPPLLGLANALAGAPVPAQVTAALGYRTADLFLKDEFEKTSRTVIATDDGTYGFHGNVIDAVRNELVREGEIPFDVICSCGPLPMLRAVKALAKEFSVPAYLSLEERMACGVGACLGCVVKTAAEDHHSHVHNARICTEGPVFKAEDVEI